jgi:hypothetical protein
MVDANTSIELCASQKVRLPKVEKFSAKRSSDKDDFAFEELKSPDSAIYIIGGKDSCQVILLLRTATSARAAVLVRWLGLSVGPWSSVPECVK